MTSLSRLTPMTTPPETELDYPAYRRAFWTSMWWAVKMWVRGLCMRVRGR